MRSFCGIRWRRRLVIMPYCIAAAVVDQQVTLETFTPSKFADRNIVDMTKKVHLSFSDVPIWPGLADVGPDTEFVGNPVTIRTTDGQSYSARVDIPRGDPALPLSDDELLSKYHDCARSQLRPDDMNQRFAKFLQDDGFEVKAMKGIEVPFKDAGKLAPEAIYNFAKKTFLEHGPADGIYMLGAGWHNLPVIEMLEKDLKTTVLSSIPAQVWATKKILHLNEPLTGYGRLLAEMP